MTQELEKALAEIEHSLKQSDLFPSDAGLRIVASLRRCMKQRYLYINDQSTLNFEQSMAEVDDAELLKILKGEGAG